MRLDASVAVDVQGVAMNLDRVAVDQNVTLDQGQVDVESFGISSQCSCQIASGDVRQTSPLLFLTPSPRRAPRCRW
jgi:hypothetical protein